MHDARLVGPLLSGVDGRDYRLVVYRDPDPIPHPDSDIRRVVVARIILIDTATGEAAAHGRQVTVVGMSTPVELCGGGITYVINDTGVVSDLRMVPPTLMRPSRVLGNTRHCERPRTNHGPTAARAFATQIVHDLETVYANDPGMFAPPTLTEERETNAETVAARIARMHVRELDGMVRRYTKSGGSREEAVNMFLRKLREQLSDGRQ